MWFRDSVENEQEIARRAELGRAYCTTFEELPEGRAVLTDLLVATGLLEISHVGGDSHGTAFAEGRRSIGLHLLERLRWSEAQLLKVARARAQGTVTGIAEGLG